MVLSLGDEQGGIAVAEETEVVRQSVVIDLAPVATHKGTHEEQERGLGLVEVRDKHTDDFVVVAWADDDLGAGVEDFEMMGIHPVSESLQRALGITLGTVPIVIRLPLGDVELVFGEVRIGEDFEAHIVEAFKGAHTGGTDGNSLTIVVEEFGDGLTTHTDVFRVHLVALHLLTLDGLERTGSHVEGQLFALDAVSIQISQHLWGEVKASRWGCHTAFDLRIDGLVGGLVAILRFTIEIGRNRQFAHHIDDGGETDISIPFKIDAMGGAVNGAARRLNGQFSIFNVQCPCQRAFLPFLQIAHQTVPGTVACGLEHLFVVGRLSRFEQEHLDESSIFPLSTFLFPLFSEVHTGLNHLRIVEYHQRTLRQIVGQVEEHVLPYYTFIIYKEF